MRRGLENALLFIYLALLPIGFNYGRLFQVRTSLLQKQNCPFCLLPLFLWDSVHWGCSCIYVSVVCGISVRSSIRLHPSVYFCMHPHFGNWWEFVHVHVSGVPRHVWLELRCHYFSRHSCNWTGLMCNPSRHFKGRGAWTDVVLLVYQMGLYDEKSVIPIQASLPSLVHYKAIQHFFYCKK